MEAVTATTNKLSDCEVAELIRQGEQPGAEALYDNYARFLYLVIIRIDPNPVAADFTLLKTFKKIWQGIDGYAEENGRIYTWMRTIAQNEAMATLTSLIKNYETKNQGLQAGKR